MNARVPASHQRARHAALATLSHAAQAADQYCWPDGVADDPACALLQATLG